MQRIPKTKCDKAGFKHAWCDPKISDEMVEFMILTNDNTVKVEYCLNCGLRRDLIQEQHYRYFPPNSSV